MESIKSGRRVKVVAGFGHSGSSGSVKVVAHPGDVPTLVRLFDTSALAVSAFKWSPKVLDAETGVLTGEGMVTNGKAGVDLSGVEGVIEDTAVLGALGEALDADEAMLFGVAAALLD